MGLPRAFGAGRGARIAWIVLLVALAATAAAVAPASAATSRPLLKTLKFPDSRIPMGIATDSAGNVYANIRVNDGQPMAVEKFDAEGNPVSFSASETYIEGNKIIGTPQGSPMEFDSSTPNGIAVDRTGGPTNGYIYVTTFLGEGGGAVYVFAPSGEYKGFFDQIGFIFTCSLTLNQSNGAKYVSDASTSQVRRYPAEAEPGNNLSARNGTLAMNSGQNCAIAADSAGNLYAAPGERGGTPLYKYPASNFNAENPPPPTEIFPEPVTALSFDTASGHLFADRGSDVVEVTTTGSQVNAPFGGLDDSHGVTAAPGNRVYASSYGGAGGSIAVFGPPAALPIDTTEPATEVLQATATLHGETDPDGSGSVTKCEFQWGIDTRYQETPIPCEQATPIASPTAVTAKLSGLEKTTTYHYRLVTTSANGVQTGHDGTFTTADYVKDVTTGEATSVIKDAATLHGSYTGQGLDTTYYFEIGTDTSYGRNVPVSPADAGVESGPQEVDPILVGSLQGETEYHYRLVMTNSLGTAFGQDRTFYTPPAITDITTGEATEVGNETAVLHGSFTADAHEVHYFFEWGATTAYGNKTPAPPGTAIAPGSGTVQVPPVQLEGLQEGGIYHYRLVASNSAGTTFGQDRFFKTAEPPQISNLGTRNVAAESADLTAEVNPNRGETEWFFEWGATTEYGNVVPATPGSIPAGSNAVPVQAHLEGLAVGVTYHFRLKASNQFGTRVTGDQSFGFYPPPCPNSQVRQETGSAHVPDCRGYELVTPGNAQGTTIFPLNAPSSGYATSPARIAYAGGYGQLPEAGEPLINVADMYVATRSPTGWTSKYMGKNTRETAMMAGPPHGMVQGNTNYGPSVSFFETATDLSMERVVSYDLGYAQFYNQIQKAYNTPYVFNSDSGAQVARWPTNLAQVPGGEDFVGWQAYSADLSHFVFSSNVAFVEGVESFPGAIHCCSYLEGEFQPGRCCPAPIYDNNTETGEIELVSEREDHSVFRGIPLKVSQDGSHIVMAETADSTLGYARPMYVRFDHQTYDIGNGAPVKFVDMTRDGSMAYFTSKEQLTPDDHDNSVDLFLWQDSNPTQLTRVSKGITGNNGDRDNCEVNWVENCDIQVLTDPSAPAENGNITGNAVTDSPVAGDSGDIYFVSPEQLDGARGSFGEANLYRYAQGALRFVTTLEPCAGCSPGRVSRIQVSPDGGAAAFITSSRVTTYDNQGHSEMYVYRPADNRVDCASCRPDGAPPVADTYGSQNGLFLTDDGRAFFSTSDPVVVNDTNEGNDVYEFVEGKPQLITTGIGQSFDGFAGFQGSQNGPGLVSVSADGVNAYFATYERLVTQDHNGQEIKIYDARTNGGFPSDSPKVECAAADECHGAGSAAPALPADRTSVPLEGDQKVGGKHKKHKRAKHKKKGHHGKRGKRPAATHHGGGGNAG